MENPKLLAKVVFLKKKSKNVNNLINEINMLNTFENYDFCPGFESGENKKLIFVIYKKNLDKLKDLVDEDEDIIDVGLKILNILKSIHEEGKTMNDFNPDYFSYKNGNIKIMNYENFSDKGSKQKVLKNEIYESVELQKGKITSEKTDIEGLCYLLMKLKYKTLVWEGLPLRNQIKNKENLNFEILQGTSFYKIFEYLRSNKEFKYSKIEKYITKLFDSPIEVDLSVSYEPENIKNFRNNLHKKLIKVNPKKLGFKVKLNSEKIIYFADCFINKYWYGCSYDENTELILKQIYDLFFL